METNNPATPISNDCNVSADSTGITNWDEWVYRLGTKLDKKMGKSGLTNAQKIELLVNGFTNN